MIKSSKCTVRFTNRGKRDNITLFLAEYKRVVGLFIDLLWDEEHVWNFVPKEITDKVETWVSATAIQCAGKQASGIVRGTKAKQKQRAFVIKQLIKAGNYKQARKLTAIYDKVKITKPIIDILQAELDSRFIKFDFDNTTTFDGWITLTRLGQKLKIKIPIKAHKHFNEMMKSGMIKPGIRLSNTTITFTFELPPAVPVASGDVIGIDVGQKSTLTCSNGQIIDKDVHGHDYQSICGRLSRKKKGSRAFGRTQLHRSNYIHWAVKRVNLSGVRKINLENIKHLRRGKRTSRALQHWNYGELFDRLESRFIDSGVLVDKRSPTYTSQRCSACGWVRKGNRKLKKFMCDKCGFTHDADLNASINLSLDLRPLEAKERLSQANKTGFYWGKIGQERIVPDTQRATDSCFS